MPTIDLTSPPPPPVGTLEGLPRRATLTLPELRLVAGAAGDAPLPFETAAPAGKAPLEDRLGASRGTTEDRAYEQALASLPDARASLERRGLLVDDRVDEGLLGAVGLLATPQVAVDLDLVVDQVQARSWHRQDADAVAVLSTVDGLVFELVWMPAAAWSGELARVAVLPEDVPLRDSEVPDHLELPFELVDGAGEALHQSRTDVVDVLAARHSGRSLDGDGRAVSEADVATALTALAAESRGRVRALVAEVSGGQPEVAGVLSWVLVHDGWRALTPHQLESGPSVVVRKAGAADLAGELAPLIAEVAR